MPNNDYILRSDALDALTVSALLRNLDSVEDGPAHMYKRAAERIIAVVPAADVEPVRHGHYIGTEFNGYADGNPVYYEWKCSECDCVFEDDEPKYRYCPNCGAKMDAEPPKEEKEDPHD